MNAIAEPRLRQKPRLRRARPPPRGVKPSDHIDGPALLRRKGAHNAGQRWKHRVPIGELGVDLLGGGLALRIQRLEAQKAARQHGRSNAKANKSDQKRRHSEPSARSFIRRALRDRYRVCTFGNMLIPA
ncbi:hypothetical protein [Methylocystis sp. Sn-Cys]|uniref:hypothetical protein n=1 Tax=Methylocystis sp. Sn-Cys TaxID=1701263 RepID=UPI001920B9BD|nr:hypothetical protein [Methylocystis sp. Sn-Cys]MBL1258605.1 hypothetical protein [Methylocystis sp. Sn-Cys]